MTFQTLHGEVATGGGFVFLRECAQLVALAHGTPWQAPAETVKLFAAFLLDGQQWMIRHRVVDAESLNNSLTETVDFEDMALAVQQLAQLGNPPRRSELAAFARRLQGQSEPLFGHRYFWRARQAVHQRPAFYVLRGVWAASPGADGCTYLLRSGTRVPAGSTFVPDDPTLPGAHHHVCRRERPAARAKRKPPGRHGRACPAASARETTAWPPPNSDARACKAKKRGFSSTNRWFASGTGLHSDLPDRPVYTTINHCRLRGPMVAHAPDGSRQLAPGQVHTVPSARTLEHDGMSPTFFPRLPSLRVTSTARADDHTNGAACPPAARCRLQIDHGVQPAGLVMGLRRFTDQRRLRIRRRGSPTR